MQAVILAAGKSTRTYPLTLNKPKPLLKIANKTILEHNLEQLKGMDEVILVVGFKQEMIRSFLSGKEYGFKITFVEQKEQRGTGHALIQAKSHLQGRFLVFVGDDLFSSRDIKNCLEYDKAILVGERNDMHRFGLVSIEKGILKSIQEKPKNGKGHANTGLFVLDKTIFSTPIKESERGEIELTDMITAVKPIHCVPVKDYWLPIGLPHDILAANSFLLKRKKTSAIIGDNTLAGSSCTIQNSSIGNGCEIGDSTKIKNSVILDATRIGRDCLIENTIIGDNCNIGQESIFSDKGTVIGDNIVIGPGTVIKEGNKVFPE